MSSAVPAPLLLPYALFDSLVLTWAGGLLVLQVVLQVLIPLLAPKNGPLAKNADVVAHQLCVTIPFVYAAYMGINLFFFDEAVAKIEQGSYADRFYGFHPVTWDVTRFFAGFQIYDLCVTALVPSLRKAEHLAHHVLSLLTACAGLSGPLLQFYCPFFFGVVEVSSVPLGLVDLFRVVPPAPGSFLSACNEVVRIAFALSFLPVRCYMFPRMLVVYLYPDLQAAYMASDVRNPIALGWFAFSGTALCAMQLYWGSKIVRILFKQFTGKEGDRSKEA